MLTTMTQEMNPNLVKRIHREIRFGNYILGSTLGEGEFGKVKLGWRKDGKLPSQVAIKLIKRDTIMKDSESEIKIHREINSLKLLNHPNIVRLVEVMKSGKYIGIVLDYASGGELFDYILHHKYLKENVAQKLFAQLVSGVDYMHCKGLIHRDLKLENLLLDKHKNVIISDFGFVNSYNREKGDFMKTSCGSPCYAAPELVLTQSPYEGKKADIWSLGVILYAMLAGYLPFDDDPDNEDGSDIVKLYQYICKTPLTFPEYINPLARDLLRKIIVPDPKKRIDMDEIRNHPWLSPHVNLLSLRQSEWDKLNNKDNIYYNPANQVSNSNKRYSMINERTTSSLITDQKSISSSQLNLYSQPSSLLSSTVAIPDNRSNSPPKISNRPYQKGHTKATSINYPSASYALKAMVQEKRNSLVEPVIMKNKVPKSNIYQGAISTIIESPTKPILSPTPISVFFNPESPENSLSPTPQLSIPSSPSTKEASKLPHKKPRPTSYHPQSMSSSLMLSNSASTSSNQQVLDYIRIPSASTLSNFFSSSPTKSLTAVSEIQENEIPSLPPPASLSTSNSINSSASKSLHLGKSNNQTTVLTNGAPIISTDDHIRSNSPTKSRRESVVTHVHASGELSNHNSPEFESKRMSVLSYLEDKIEHLELSNINHTNDGISSSPIQNPSLDTEPSSETKDDLNEVKLKIGLDQLTTSTNIESGETNLTERPITQDTKVQPNLVKLPKDTLESNKNLQQDRSNSGVTQTRSKTNISDSKLASNLREANKENLDLKETKKRNRFSLLSFYSSGYGQSSSNISIHSTNNASSKSGANNQTAHTDKRKILEPSNEVNSSKSLKEKRIHSNGSSSSKKSTKANSSTSSSSVNGKEAGAARKVMDFFKRRSVRIG